ncbi:hypothetical protein [Mycobacterium sp. 1081908.1]|uniref:hypothetical protein n=1 Tax=Mycobacterium sp. 1081908.1 TaxID=1834066 RepID=UPI0007FB93A5|nr:hypothetical protein [Mycobacterium sp. 1081908.1]OBK46932.1 hypothetical protein A5655_08040 [Mycobacterium sp. 1081908.1]
MGVAGMNAGRTAGSGATIGAITPGFVVAPGAPAPWPKGALISCANSPMPDWKPLISDGPAALSSDGIADNPMTAWAARPCAAPSRLVTAAPIAPPAKPARLVVTGAVAIGVSADAVVDDAA